MVIADNVEASPMPDSKSIQEWQEFIAESRAIIKTAVVNVYRKYNGYAPPDDVEELTEKIILLLLDHDCHKIQTYDPSKGDLKTWLPSVVRNSVWAFIEKKRKWDSLEETVAEKLMEQPKQELNIILQEQQIALTKEIEKLSEHDRRLILLIYNEMPIAEIAKRLKIKPDSVYRMKHQIIQKIRANLKMGGGQFPCQSSRQEK